MKNFYAFALLLTVALGYGQIPTGYYNNATGTGYALKTQLKTIIFNGHNPKSYDALWTLYQNTAYKDHYYENDNTLLDVYSEKPGGTDSYTFSVPSDQCGSYTGEGSCYNREHVIPKSYFASAAPMYSDAHHLFPTDGYVNNKRDNFPFGKVGTATWTSTNGSKLGPNLNSGYSAGFTGTVFEPIDEFKGDIARAYFYFATRYESNMPSLYTNAPSTTEVKAMFDGSSNRVFSSTFLNILLTWHQQDPVSPREIAINNAIYSHQGNRNPYIDHPEYVNTVWGNALFTPSFDALSIIAVYPNPSNNHRINIDSEVQLDEIQLVNINGQIMQEIKNPAAQSNTYTVENIPSGFYFLRLTSDSQSTTKKVIIN